MLVNKIEELNLSNNKIETLPNRFLFNMPNLTDLNLCANKIYNLSFIDSDSHVKRLMICNNNIARIGKRIMNSELEYLDLSSNKLANVNNLCVAFPNIEVLYISHNEITVIEDLKGIEDCENLIELSICGNPVHCNGINEIMKRRLNQLEILDGVELYEEPLVKKQIIKIEQEINGKIELSNNQHEIESDSLLLEDGIQEITKLSGSYKDVDAKATSNLESLQRFYDSYADRIINKLTEIQVEVGDIPVTNCPTSHRKVEIQNSKSDTLKEIIIQQQYTPKLAENNKNIIKKSKFENSDLKNIQKQNSTNTLFRIKQPLKTSNQLKKVINSTLTLRNPRLLKQQTELLRSQFKDSNN